MKPIVLWNGSRRRTVTSDEAGVGVIKDVLPPPNIPGPYESIVGHDRPFTYVPPLTCLCIRRLLEYPDQLHLLEHIRLLYQAPPSKQSFDILRALIPNFDLHSAFDPSQLDPRLWAVLTQLYSNLPQSLRSYPIPLSDKHLPLLQCITCTPHYALISILELPRCCELTDETVIQLRHLHNLSALDASRTSLTGYGIKVLAATLQFGEGDSEKRGPWGLRVLYLRDCLHIENDVLNHLSTFVLLTVVGTYQLPLQFSFFAHSPQTSAVHDVTPISGAFPAVSTHLLTPRSTTRRRYPPSSTF
jgi:hypothetical protein